MNYIKFATENLTNSVENLYTSSRKVHNEYSKNQGQIESIPILLRFDVESIVDCFDYVCQ